MSHPPSPPLSPVTTEMGEQVRLEVQEKGTSSTGEAVWTDAGPIHLLDTLQFSSASVPTSSSSTQQLPKAAKEWLLSKNVIRTKKDRQNLYLFRHSSSRQQLTNTNLLVLLHGAGDSHRPFDTLAKTMSLPQTATLSLNARICGIELPFNLGYSWFHEQDYYGTGDMLLRNDAIRNASLQHAVQFLHELIKRLHSAWIPERIFLLGYGAGATLAMEVCRLWTSQQPLGGAICVDVGLGEITNLGHLPNTPILFLSQDPKQLKQCKEDYENNKRSTTDLVETYVQPKKGMMSSPQEMRAVMTWLAPRLVLSTQLSSTPPDSLFHFGNKGS